MAAFNFHSEAANVVSVARLFHVFSTMEGIGFFVLCSVFLRQADICIFVAKIARRASIIFIEKIRQILWGMIFQRVQNYNHCLCGDQLLYGFYSKLSKRG